MSQSLPAELLREIVLYLLYGHPYPLTSEDDDLVKPSWGLLASFSLTSKQARALALEAWFIRLRVTSPDDLLESNIVFSEIKLSWTREICVQLLPGVSFWNIEGFKSLRKIRFEPVNVDGMPLFLPHNFSGLSFSESASLLPEVEIREIAWPSPSVLQRIAMAFPALKILRLQQQRVWCELCFACCVPSFKAPGPKNIRYENGEGLPIHYSKVLSSLSNLEAVYLTVGDLGFGRTILRDKDSANENLWAGECDQCMNLMYSDDSFRQEWISRKKNATPKPPRLSAVDWRFFPLQEEDVVAFPYETESDDEQG